MSSIGTFRDGVARGDWKVVEGAGSGELLSISGEGSLEAPAGPQATFTLHYDSS